MYSQLMFNEYNQDTSQSQPKLETICRSGVWDRAYLPAANAKQKSHDIALLLLLQLFEILVGTHLWWKKMLAGAHFFRSYFVSIRDVVPWHSLRSIDTLNLSVTYLDGVWRWLSSWSSVLQSQSSSCRLQKLTSCAKTNESGLQRTEARVLNPNFSRQHGCEHHPKLHSQ